MPSRYREERPIMATNRPDVRGGDRLKTDMG